jgi:myosin heavy subunit
MKRIALLLKVQPDSLAKAFTFKTRQVQKGVPIDSPMNRADCVSQRDSIARELYDCQFSWLIRKVNSILLT